jgi:hypothetical protein
MVFTEDMNNTAATTTQELRSAAEFLVLCRSRLSAGRQVELDNRIARHANRIAAERDVELEVAVLEATAQFGAELRTSIAAEVAR